MADGIIIKYDRFYLKVYNDDSELEETFHLYNYNETNPILTVKLNWSQMVHVGKLLHNYTTISQAKTLLAGLNKYHHNYDDSLICEC